MHVTGRVSMVDDAVHDVNWDLSDCLRRCLSQRSALRRAARSVRSRLQNCRMCPLPARHVSNLGLLASLLFLLRLPLPLLLLLLHLLLLHLLRTVVTSRLLVIKKPAGDGSGGGWSRLPRPLHHLSSVPVLHIRIFKHDLVLPGR